MSLAQRVLSAVEASLRHLLSQMIHAAWNQPQPWPKHHREWLERMEQEAEKSP